ncbi:MAG TPA: GNAT family N-acetyltransferase [Capillimicrobium sp.]|nr:GNAT family N-acetyltransferase [Capillimicrobium sp.]
MPYAIRRDLRPGDLGAISALHGRVYAAEHGLDATFEADVAAWMADHVRRGFPRAREGLWVVEDDGRVAGSLALTDEGDGLGRVRWFLLEPAARGRGLGRRMLDELLDHARASGYACVELGTFSALTTAAAAYRRAGFRRVRGDRRRMWGRTIVLEHYELELDVPAASAAR